MGNYFNGIKITVNVTSLNVTNDSTPAQGSSNQGNSFLGSPFGAPRQSISEIDAELVCFAVLCFLAITINSITLDLLRKKFKTIPHVLLQNLVVVDLLTPLLTGPYFVLGLIVPMIGTVLPSACNVQGFFHATLAMVFLNNVSVIAASRYLACYKPSLYHRVFANKINVRILLLAIWTSSALICVPPMNGWGAYQMFEATCWLAWLPSNKANLSYNIIFIIPPLGVAVVTCLAGFKVVFNNKKVHSTPHPSQEPEQNVHIAEPTTSTPRINTEIFIIAAVEFLVYILLWVPLTVMNWYFLKDWRIVDIRVTISILILYFGRSLFNPIILYAVSSQVRHEFVSLFCYCRCSDKQSEDADMEM